MDAVAHYAAALSYDMDGRHDDALKEYALAAKEDPSYEPVVVESARRYIRTQKAGEAIPLLEGAAARKDASGTVFAWLGLAYGQAGEDDKAIGANKKAIQKSPHALAAYQNLSQLYLQNGKTNEALRVLDRAAKQKSVDVDFLIDLADLNARFGRTRLLDQKEVRERVAALLDRAANRKPQNPIILQRLGDSYARVNETAKAERIYRQLLEQFPRMPLMRTKLADLYLRTGEREKARAQLEEIAKENPTNARTQAVLGALALESADATNAVRHLERAVALGPEVEEVYYDLARANLILQKPNDALSVLERARLKFKANFMLDFYTGMAYALRERYSDAVTYYLSAEILAKNRAEGPIELNSQFYFRVGAAYERSGDPEQAETYFEKCLELSPDNAEALNYLGYMWADLGINLDRARVLIEKAVGIEPNNAAFLDSHAWVLFKLNRPTEALPHILKAIENSDEADPVLYDHLGDIHQSLGSPDKAREAWRKSLNSKEDPKVRRKLESAAEGDS